MSITKMKAKADELFGKNYQEFEVEDPFNKGNWLKGYISRRPTELYGALLITQVNGQEIPQLIYGTPKMHYPFDRSGRYTFPSAKTIEVFDKLDGTNVLAYCYTGPKGAYQTYKTRVMPILKAGRFGDFPKMWEEMLDKYPAINKICLQNRCHISFELYGSRNKHLFLYDVLLDCAVLFGVTYGGTIISPTGLNLLDLPMVSKAGTISSNYVEYYKWHQLQLEQGLKTIEEGYRGTEGQVWYLSQLTTG